MIGRVALALTGAAWLYEAPAVVWHLWPTITNHVHRHRHRKSVALAVFVGIHAVSAWAHCHLLVED